MAALNVALDFDFIEGGANQSAPKYMEWYSAFGLLVTLVWLYVEVLRAPFKDEGEKIERESVTFLRRETRHEHWHAGKKELTFKRGMI